MQTLGSFRIVVDGVGTVLASVAALVVNGWGMSSTIWVCSICFINGGSKQCFCIVQLLIETTEESLDNRTGDS